MTPAAAISRIARSMPTPFGTSMEAAAGSGPGLV